LKAKKEGVKTKAENTARSEQMPSPVYYSLFAASKCVHNNDDGIPEVRRTLTKRNCDNSTYNKWALLLNLFKWRLTVYLRLKSHSQPQLRVKLQASFLNKIVAD